MRNHAAQLAIIKQLSRQELHSTAGNCQADDRQESPKEYDSMVEVEGVFT